MASTNKINASTFTALTTFTQTVSAPSLTITNSSNNTFLGITLPTSVGGNNTSIGNANFAQLVSGTGNIGIGQQVFLALPSGTDNIAIGRQSGANAPASTTRCTFIGPQSGNVIFGGPFTDSTAIGSGSAVDASNQIMMGRSTETVVFPGNTTFNAHLPTSTATPTLASQFVTKTYSDTTYSPKQVTSSISYTGTLRTTIPYGVSYSGFGATSTMVPTLAMNFNNENSLLTLTFNDTCILSNFNIGTFTLLTSVSGPNVIGLLGTNSGTYSALTTFSFPNLQYIVIFSPTFSVLTNFSLPACVTMINAFAPVMPLCTTFSMPLLQSAITTFTPNMPILTTFSLPAVTFLNSFSPTLTACTSFSLPLLSTMNSINLTLPALTTFTLPSLATCDLTFALTLALATSISLSALANVGTSFAGTFATVTSFSLPAIVNIGTTFTITAANLVTFSFGSTLKKIGGNVTMTGMKLNQASVDSILVSLAALDGTNGTTAYSGFTVNLSGGTSSTPSATGLAAKTTLQGRGCTVTNN